MNPVVHFEIPYEDPERIAQFYQTVFDWRMEVLGEEMGGYILVTTAETDVKPGSPSGAIDGGFYPKKADWPLQYPSVVIAVEDIDKSIIDINQAGGEVLGAPIDIPNVGLYVSFIDSEGNRISMLQPVADIPTGN